mgnify:CR=1 FL=1
MVKFCCWKEECNVENAAFEAVSSMAGSVEMLRELMDACSPYLKRKKMTPRHECNKLNRVWAKCAKHLEKPNRVIGGK